MNGIASPLSEGLLWSWLVPTAVFLVAAGATWLLYRAFANRG